MAFENPIFGTNRSTIMKRNENGNGNGNGNESGNGNGNGNDNGSKENCGGRRKSPP